MKDGFRYFRFFSLKFISLAVFFALILTYIAMNLNFNKDMGQGRVKGVKLAEHVTDEMYLKNKVVEGTTVVTSAPTTTVSGTSTIKARPRHYFPKPTLSPEILDFHRRLNLTNPGHLSDEVVLPENLPIDIELMVSRSRDLYLFNEFVANLVPLDRELYDYRTSYCKDKKYSERLPVASVIMIFHNEPLSMILRTVYSVLNRTPVHLLREIILVDDCSSHRKTLMLNFD